MLLYSVVLSLFVAASLGQNACDMSKESMMKYGMECLSHDPDLMLQIIEHMDNPEALANMEFVCSHEHAVVDVAMCMEKKLSGCLPQEVYPLLQQLFKRKRLDAALAFVCQHKKELATKCMEESDNQEFAVCMQDKAQMLSQVLTSPQLTGAEARQLLCRFDLAFNQCLEGHHGTCTGKYVQLFEQMVKMMLPQDICSGLATDTKLSPASKLLGSLLIHGQPLKFEPSGNRGPQYNI